MTPRGPPRFDARRNPEAKEGRHGGDLVGLTLAAPLTSAAVHIVNELRDRDAGTPTIREAAPVAPV